MCILFSASLKEKIQELTVEDKMLSMTEIKIKEEVKAMERELLEVGKLMVKESSSDWVMRYSTPSLAVC